MWELRAVMEMDGARECGSLREDLDVMRWVVDLNDLLTEDLNVM